MPGLLLQVADTLSVKIPSFTDRFNFTLPLIIVLFILMLFLMLKAYAQQDTQGTEHKDTKSVRPQKQKNKYPAA